MADGKQYPPLSLCRTRATLNVCTQRDLLFPNIWIAIDEDSSCLISPRKEYLFRPSKQASNSRKRLPIRGDPPSPAQVHKAVRRRNLQPDHLSLAIAGEPPSTNAGLD